MQVNTCVDMVVQLFIEMLRGHGLNEHVEVPALLARNRACSHVNMRKADAMTSHRCVSLNSLQMSIFRPLDCSEPLAAPRAGCLFDLHVLDWLFPVQAVPPCAYWCS